MKMRLALFLLVAPLVLNSADAQNKPSTKNTGSVALAKTPVKDIGQGKALLPKYDCLACHKLKDKLVGPSYLDVAHKYPATPANIALLSQKVIKGGSGRWGSAAMAAHPNLAEKDATKMVAYILSVK